MEGLALTDPARSCTTKKDRWSNFNVRSVERPPACNVEDQNIDVGKFCASDDMHSGTILANLRGIHCRNGHVVISSCILLPKFYKKYIGYLQVIQDKSYTSPRRTFVVLNELD